jgi:hypothetical protein
VSTRLRLATAAIAPISFATVAISLLRSNNWAAWGVEALPATTPATVSFGDLANITATADCLANNTPINGCDPYGRPFQPYVELPARLLNFLGLGTSETGPIGTGLAIIFLLTITAVTLAVAIKWTRGIVSLTATQGLIALISISPASMLAVERGQVEQLTLGLVVVALLAFSSEISTKFSRITYLGIATSIAATVTKYLSIGMFLPFVHRQMFTKRNTAIILGGALSVLYVLVSIPSVMQAAETSRATTPQTTKSAFSVTTLLATAFSGNSNSYLPTNEVANNWGTITIASYALFVISVIAWVAILLTKARGSKRTHQVQKLDRSGMSWLLTLGGGGVLLFPYLLGNSHDYRLIFLIPTAAGAALLAQSRPVTGSVLAISAAGAAITSATMVPLPNGFIWPSAALVAGDAALMVLLSGVAALWLTTAFKKVAHK